MKKGNRKKGLLIYFTPDEREYLTRLSKDTGYSCATLIRMKVFKSGWETKLAILRVAQDEKCKGPKCYCHVT